MQSPADPLARVRACIAEAERLADLPPAELEPLRRRAQADVFNLVVLGEFKRGKSSAINALLGVSLLPVGVVPLTAIATLLSYGEQVRVEVALDNGERLEIGPEALTDYVTEKGNPRNAKGVREVRVQWPSPWLASGVRLIDTPGIGSVHLHNTDVTYRFLPKADAVLFLLSVDQPAGHAETEFLKEVRGYAGRIFFLLNKADLLTESELTESVEFASQVISDAIGRPAMIYPVSARLALEGYSNGDPQRLAQSRFPAFSEELAHFLMEGKGKALAVSVAKALLRLVSQSRRNAELALASLHTPVEELTRKVALFQAKREEVEQERRDFSILIQAEVARLATEVVAEDVEAFKRGLGPEVERAIKARFQAARHLTARAVRADLEQTAVEAVRTGWDGFRRDEDERIGQRCQGLCARFSSRIDATVDALYRFSSELFALPYEVVGAETVWGEGSNFYYKFWDEPPALKTLTGSLVSALPRLLAIPLVLRQALGYGRDLADTQAGRVRYDFAQRLERSMRDFEDAMLGRIDATLAGIENAIGRGLEGRAEGAARANQRADQLSAELDRSARLAAELRALAGLEGGA